MQTDDTQYKEQSEANRERERENRHILAGTHIVKSYRVQLIPLSALQFIDTKENSMEKEKLAVPPPRTVSRMNSISQSMVLFISLGIYILRTNRNMTIFCLVSSILVDLLDLVYR